MLLMSNTSRSSLNLPLSILATSRMSLDSLSSLFAFRTTISYLSLLSVMSELPSSSCGLARYIVAIIGVMGVRSS